MSLKFRSCYKACDVTPKKIFLERRKFITALGAGAIAGAVLPAELMAKKLGTVRGKYSLDIEPSKYDDITQYNNFYEFGTDKSDPARYAHQMTTHPWSVKIDGLVEKPGMYALDDLLKNMVIEERIYRFRCVEAWAMVVPWNGFQLSDLLKQVGVRSKARYVAFETLYRPTEMRGQKSRVLEWPYREGLRLDEAMHPLSLIATGIYGESLLGQNGAPLRLVVPWKYGFKSIKSIVRITLTEKMPPTSWNMSNPSEYGFYSNVNPFVNHPRWSQDSERMLGAGLFARRVPTRMFNGYADEVASLYKGMDLKEHF